MTASQRIAAAFANEQPLQIAGTINVYSALLAKHSGFQAVYLSGEGLPAGHTGCRIRA